MTLPPFAMQLLVGIPIEGSMGPPDMPIDDGRELTEEDSLFLSSPFPCAASGQDDCDADCAEAYLLKEEDYEIIRGK